MSEETPFREPDNRLMPLPPGFRAEKAASWMYTPDMTTILEEAGRWRRLHDIPPASQDKKRVIMLLVDLQKDFCLPEGTLFVNGRNGNGAIGDNTRVTRFIYRNLKHLTEVICTLDTHYPYQIFFPSFWVTDRGLPPPAYTEVSAEMIRNGELRPNPAMADMYCGGNQTWLLRQVIDYCSKLEENGRYKLYLWPPHCLLGSDGHCLAGVVQEARLFHSFARGSQALMEIKGTYPLTENYSVLGPEVLLSHDGQALGERNQELTDHLLSADAIIVAGQAASHCVRHTLEDLFAEIQSRDVFLADRVYVLTDCMTPIAVSDPQKSGAYLQDFTQETQKMFDRLQAAGMHLVESTGSVAEWLEL